MDLALIFTALAVLCLLAMSGFFSGSETALTAASRARMHQIERSGDARAGVVARLLATRERLIGALLLGNNLVNILASALATSVFLRIFGDAGVVYATLVMTALVLVFAEVLPKTYAINNADKMALTVSRAVAFITQLFGPVVMAVEAIVRRVLKLLGAGIEADDPMLSPHEELRGAVDLLHQEGGVVKDDRDRLGGLLDLREMEVSDVMVHRTAMRMLNAEDPPETLVAEALASPYTRLPLWKGGHENIVGVLHAKDLLRAVQAAGSVADLDVMSVTSEPWFVPDTTSLDAQLQAFLRRKSHFAIVVDEYGAVMGLVTLEDILEEIVGEIADEHDIEMEGVRPQPDGTVIVDGGVPIRDLNRLLDWSLPDDEVTTVAGLVIHEARTIPEAGQAFTFHGMAFRVLRRDRNRVAALRITPPEGQRRAVIRMAVASGRAAEPTPRKAVA
ncbi:MAG: HlyC/CorC family transporter [Pseudomonadota bacterium]